MPTASTLSKPVLGFMLFLLAVGAVAFAADLIRQRAMARDVAEALTWGRCDTSSQPRFADTDAGGCHTIAGIAGADGKVGGRLSDLRQQVYIGGVRDKHAAEPHGLDRGATAIFTDFGNACYRYFRSRSA